MVLFRPQLLVSFLTDSEDPPPNMDDFMDHIDYMVEKIGIDHVGISSDFDGGGGISRLGGCFRDNECNNCS